MRCDLHTHSLNSDGSATPAELIAAAKQLGLIIALTDHNTALGLPEFMKEASENGVTAVSGTELSCAHGDNEFHLLGLFIKPEYYRKVDRLAKEFHVLKEISNIEMVERLNLAGYNINYADVKKRNPNGNANRAHVAAELMEKGYVSSVAEAFATILSDSYGFYIQPVRLQLVDAIHFLREIEALPILAHPLKDIDAAGLERILPELIDAGLLGIETMHSSYSDDDIAVAKSIAERFGLVESGGSDYHGKVKPDVHLGVGKGNLDISEDVYYGLLDCYERNYPKKSDN